MKRTATLVVAIMALTLTACKADNNPKKQDNSAMTTEQTGVTNQNEGKETKMTVNRNELRDVPTEGLWILRVILRHGTLKVISLLL